MTNKVKIQNAINFETVIFCRKFHIVLYHRIITLRIIMHFWEIMGNLYMYIFVVGKNYTNIQSEILVTTLMVRNKSALRCAIFLYLPNCDINLHTLFIIYDKLLFKGTRTRFPYIYNPFNNPWKIERSNNGVLINSLDLL